MAATATAPVPRLPRPVTVTATATTAAAPPVTATTATAPVPRLCLRGRPTEDLLGRDATKLAGNQLDWTGIASDELSIAPAFALLTMMLVTPPLPTVHL